MAANNADQYVCLVLFTEVSTKAALSILNRFHILHLLCLTTFRNHSSMPSVLCKLRLIWAQISTTESVVNVKPQKIEGLENCAASA
jgi:hypothetical protein